MSEELNMKPLALILIGKSDTIGPYTPVYIQPNDEWDEWSEEVDTPSFHRFLESCRRGENVIADNTDMTLYEIAPYICAAQSHGYDVWVLPYLRAIAAKSQEEYLEFCSQRRIK